MWNPQQVLVHKDNAPSHLENWYLNELFVAAGRQLQPQSRIGSVFIWHIRVGLFMKDMWRRKGVVDPVRGVLAAGLIYFIHAFSTQSSRWILSILKNFPASWLSLSLVRTNLFFSLLLHTFHFLHQCVLHPIHHFTSCPPLFYFIHPSLSQLFIIKCSSSGINWMWTLKCFLSGNSNNQSWKWRVNLYTVFTSCMIFF